MNRSILSLSLLAALTLTGSAHAFRSTPQTAEEFRAINPEPAHYMVTQHSPAKQSVAVGTTGATQTMQPALAKTWGSAVATAKALGSYLSNSRACQWGKWAISQPNAIKAWQWSKWALSLPSAAIAWPTTKILNAMFCLKYINRVMGPKTAAFLGSILGLMAFYGYAPLCLSNAARATLGTLLTLSFSMDMVERLNIIVTALHERRWRDAATELATCIILGALVFEAPRTAVTKKILSWLGYSESKPLINPDLPRMPAPPQTAVTQKYFTGPNAPQLETRIEINGKFTRIRVPYWHARHAIENCAREQWFGDEGNHLDGFTPGCLNLMKEIKPENYASQVDTYAVQRLAKMAAKNCMQEPTWWQRLLGAKSPTPEQCVPKVVDAIIDKNLLASTDPAVAAYDPNTSRLAFEFP